VAKDDDESPGRSLLLGVGALVGVALLVGSVISLVALGAVTVTGLSGSDSEATAEPTLYIPEHSQTASDDDEGTTLADLNGGVDPRESESTSPTPDESETPKPEKKDKRKRAPSVISLSASPNEVAPMEQIYLSGTYPRGEGASLQVQRFSGGWTDFPSSATVSGGTFTTYVMTGQSGVNKFRVMDRATGKKSNPVTVTVR
jgi:hypothetical protein